MQKHTKIYFEESQRDPYGFIPCEICNAMAQDIHHIDARGMGGNPSGDKDTFANLMALCRTCHDDFGDKTLFKDYLRRIHSATFPDKLTYNREDGTIKQR